LLSASVLLSFQDTLRINYDNYKPFHWLDENNNDKGIFIDILNEILVNQMNIKIIYHEYPWARAQINVKLGIEDAFITTPTQERLGYVTPNKTPIIYMQKVPYTQINNPDIDILKKVQNINDLKDFEILDYLGNGWAKKTLVDHNVTWVEDPNQALNMLANNKGDVFIENPIIIDFTLEQMGLTGKLERLPVSFDSAPFHLFIKKDSPLTTLLDEFDIILRQLQIKGFIEDVIEKYKF